MFFSSPWPPPLPSRKISETLLDFAVPVTATLPRDVQPDTLQRALEIAVAVWNAIVLDAWGKDDGSHLERTRHDMLRDSEAMPEPQRGLLRWGFGCLVRRKRKRRFRRDLRAIAGLHVYSAPSGEPRIRAEWKLSDELRRHYGLP